MSTRNSFRLQNVHHVIIDQVFESGELATGKVTRWTLVEGSLKSSRVGGSHLLRFRVKNEGDASEILELILREDGDEYSLRGEFWSEDAEQECSLFDGGWTAILTCEDGFDLLYVYLDGQPD